MQIKTKEGRINKDFLNPMSAITLLRGKKKFTRKCDMPYGIKRLYVCVHKGHAAATSFTYLDNKTLEYTNVHIYNT